MKKSIGLLFVLILFAVLAINLISAIEIKLSKEAYNPGETLQLEITGSFISLSNENILIYENNTPRAQPVVSDLIKHGEIYYFYAILPNQQSNYSLKIENAEYTEQGAKKTDTITKSFTIIKTNDSALQINPGFVSASSDFSVKVKSLNSNQEITAIFNQQSQDVLLIEDIEKSISFSIANMTSGKYDLKINAYTIPIFVVEKTSINNTLINQTNINQTLNVSDLNKTEIEEYIKNLGNKTESLSCSSIGKICLDTQECEGEIVPSIDGNCCIGNCNEATKSNTGTIIGIALLIIVIVLVVFIYLRAKKRQKPKSTDEILKDKQKQFEKRMQEDSSEVIGRLGKI